MKIIMVVYMVIDVVYKKIVIMEIIFEESCLKEISFK